MDNNYLDYYRKRVFRVGATPKERIANSLNNDFHELIRTSPNSVDITYKNRIYNAILNSGNSRIGAQTERKVLQYLLTDLNLKLPEGAVFTMCEPLQEEQTTWIILHREIHSYYGYYKYKIVELDYTVKYVDEYGNIEEVPAYINGTGEFDIKEYFRYSLGNIVEIPNRALNVIWAANSDIKVGVRIMIGDEVWRVVDSDKISIPGIYYTTLYKTTRNVLTDDYSEQLADSDKATGTQILSNYGKEIIISVGTDDLYFYCMREGKIFDGDFEFSTDDEKVLRIEDGKCIAVGEGVTALKVHSVNSDTTMIFPITVQNTDTSIYCHKIGDNRMPVDSKMVWLFNTNIDIDVSADNDLVKIKQENNKITIQSKMIIGTTNITADGGGGNKWIYPLEIQSMWVSN